jgi:hypothetical protein
VARHDNGIHEVSGSIPLGSTNNISILEQKFERSRSAEIVLRTEPTLNLWLEIAFRRVGGERSIKICRVDLHKLPRVG